MHDPDANPLERYEQKRDFKQTSEPRGDRPTDEGRLYCIQKHDATRLHYDFRLEHNGVLLSWAVPKGPSYDTHVKRLAVKVEDHPVSYGRFEGTIPKGNYGAGTVIVWDIGSWRPLGDVDQMLRDGALKFELDGERLRGKWALIKLHDEEAKDNWLLIKEKDDEAIPDDADGVIHRFTDSALRRPESVDPYAFRPQLATLSETTPPGRDWIHEVKFDGYRMVAWRTGDRVRMVSRNGLDWTDRFTHIAEALEDLLPVGAAVDGEVVAFDERGKSDFGRLQAWLKNGRGPKPSYVVFDVVMDRGELITDRPLHKRKDVLAQLISEQGPVVRISEAFEGDGDDLFASACKLGLEGIVTKKRSAPYTQARSHAWLKRKCENNEEFVVGGFTRGKGSRGQLGALLLGQYNSEGQLVFNGKVGTGFDDQTLAQLTDELEGLLTDRSPFYGRPRDIPRNALFVQPRIVVQVRFVEKTSAGSLRHASYLGRREDKVADDVKPERAANKPDYSGVKVTHPDRVLFSDVDVTKGDLADYYDRAADHLLPFIAGRPLAVVRCPEGTAGPCFFQKHVGAGMPDWLARPVENEDEPLIVVDDRKGLLTLVQFGVIELHPWGSLANTVEQPDTLTFDLDPGPGVSWPTVVSAGLAVRERLRDLGLPSFVKTSGGKGLHVVVPMVAGSVDWASLKEFAKRVAEDMVQLVPDHFVSNMAKSKRRGKIFLDYLRNGRGATSVAAFSVRSREGAPVSVPVRWDDLSGLAGPAAFTVQNSEAWLNDGTAKSWLDFWDSAAEISEEAFRQLGMKTLKR